MASRRLLTVELIGGYFPRKFTPTLSENRGFNQSSEFTEHLKLYLWKFKGVQKVANQGSELSLKGLDLSSFTQCVAWGAYLLVIRTLDK